MTHVRVPLASSAWPREDRGPVLALAAAAFLLLAAWAVIRSASAGLLAGEVLWNLSPAALRASAAAGQALVLLVTVPLFSLLARRVPHLGSPAWLSVSFSAQLVTLWALQSRVVSPGATGGGFFLFVWSGLFGVVAPAVFWTFAARPALRAAIPYLALAASGGAVSGSWLAGAVLSSGRASAADLLLIAAVLSAGAGFVLHAASAGEGASGATASFDEREDRLRRAWSGRRRHYAAAIAAATLLVAWAQTNAESVLFGLVSERAAVAGEAVVDRVAVFYGRLQMWAGLLALTVQAVVALRLAPRGEFGVTGFVILPVLTMFSTSVLALAPLLGLASLFRVTERATEHSLHNTARQLLWLPLPPAITRRIKPTVDTFFVRLGDALGGLTVVGVLAATGDSISPILVMNVGLAALAVAAATVAVREHRRVVASNRESRNLTRLNRVPADARAADFETARVARSMRTEPGRGYRQWDTTRRSDAIQTPTARFAPPPSRRSSSWSIRSGTAAAPKAKWWTMQSDSSRHAA